MNHYLTNENLSGVVCVHVCDCASVGPSDLFAEGLKAV